ncbi:YARHG domain-containing protein [Rapidithrix thailandica]|uniref:YARHG domain-containing protein n=1 Tax=Rapidithrix thailandica TaxID=413964 RepID=A0AAW9SGQ9_9BACT
MRILFLFSFVLTAALAKANDGAYYASGNHLIPINETTVSVSKEVLKIERVHEDYIKVTVDYIFHNPGAVKDILVGFEAPSPNGDVNGTPKNGRHPYIENFKVIMNGEELSYKVAMVQDDAYYQNEQIKSISVQKAMGDTFNPNEPDFYYVYHFNTNFQPGTNTIKHEYQFKVSGSVDLAYDFHYILTAANRWANQQIDDFTLILDLGDFTDYNISQTFFTGFEYWTGATKFMDGTPLPYSETETQPLRVITNEATVVFKKKNFKPVDELYIYCKRNTQSLQTQTFDHTKLMLPYNVADFKHLMNASNENAFKILRNLPFARRGYIFKNELIQKYFESLEWYQPNPSYQANVDLFGKEEREWLLAMKAANR